jgi:CheY-like chemotaxis protein
VDDEPDLLELLEVWFESCGCSKIFMASNGRDALSILTNNPIDLLVTDVRMPIMDGIELVRHLARLDKPIPSIVFISGFGDLDQREMYGLGVEAFLSKPIPSAQLVEVAAKALVARSDLWMTPMEAAPRQFIEIQMNGAGDLTDLGSIQFGRGGFSAYYPGQITMGKVSFRCHSNSAQPALTGEGYVRWRSRTDNKIGIEFSFLSPDCRSWLSETLTRINPPAYIPSWL